MKRLTGIFMLLSTLAALALAASPSTGPESQPATAATTDTRPSTQPASAPAMQTASSRTTAARPFLTPAASWETYRVLAEKNMFLKDRTRPPARGRTRTASPRDTRSDEECTTLMGIVWQGQQWVAFLEDVRTGKVQRAAAGDAVCHGTLGLVTLDAVQYCVAEATSTISVGKTLAGTGPASQAATTGATSETASEPATGAASSSSPTNDVLERMRQRRAQEESQ